MPEKMKLTPEEKLDILMHILNLIDEQNMISFAEDKFGAYFNEETKPFIESYLNAMNSKKTLQFMVYGEPGMINEHYIKIASFSKYAKEIQLQIDLIKARHKDTVLAMNDEIKNLSAVLAQKEKEASGNMGDDEKQRLEMTEKVDAALDYSEKLNKSLRKNKNLSVLEGVVNETQDYLKAVKILSGEFEALQKVLLEPMMEENRKGVQKLTLIATLGVFGLVFISIIIGVLF